VRQESWHNPFNWEIGDVIIERLAQGESLRAITKDPAMPSLATVLKWVANDVEGFAKPYNEARVAQAHAWAEDILEIIDDSSGDYIVGVDGRREFNGEHEQRSKLRYEERRWLASKALPRIYGDRNMTEISGPGGAHLGLQHHVPHHFNNESRKYQRVAIFDPKRPPS
jgi:hypothetical protein